MILLDTHAFLWFINDDDRLPAAIKDTIESTEMVFVSIASFWEMAIKNSLGKLDIPGEITSLMDLCAEQRFTILPIRGPELNRLKALPRIHNDPFDRLLICQAQENGLILVTKDENIEKYGFQTMWG